ncbi:MAG: hypothetical protein ACREUQ_07970, partial [Burkholderiales bacterium]
MIQTASVFALGVFLGRFADSSFLWLVALPAGNRAGTAAVLHAIRAEHAELRTSDRFIPYGLTAEQIAALSEQL